MNESVELFGFGYENKVQANCLMNKTKIPNRHHVTNTCIFVLGFCTSGS